MIIDDDDDDDDDDANDDDDDDDMGFYIASFQPICSERFTLKLFTRYTSISVLKSISFPEQERLQILLERGMTHGFNVFWD